MHSLSQKTFLIAGTHSGCGKTSVSLGLMAALVRRGIRVQPFKAGPDFIDPGHHEAVTGAISHNLDGWMLNPSTVRSIHARHMQDKDLGIIEGAMGLFDGISGTSDQGSAAQLAKILDVPVVLVVDARGMARSAAALVKGYADFDPDLCFAGVIFNKVGSARHEEILRKAMAPLPEIPVLGCLGKNNDLSMDSRHLGLVMAHETGTGDRIDLLTDWITGGMDVRSLIDGLPKPASVPQIASTVPKAPRVRIGVARDAAFCFYYQENLRALEEAGAEIVPFSPLKDATLPPDVQGLYLGGGYPELFAAELAANISMLEAVRTFAHNDHPLYAECGGYMYLMKTLQDKEGTTHKMAGVFDCACRMQRRFAALGYREVQTTSPGMLGPAGSLFRGHEFHYSRLEGKDPLAQNIYAVKDRNGSYPKGMGLVKHRVLGSYIHLHFASNPHLATWFVRTCAGETPA